MMDILILICLAMLIALLGFTLFLVNLMEKDINHLIDLIECGGVGLDDFRSQG